MNEMFEQILEKNENIIEILKPNKAKYFISNLIFATLFGIFIDAYILGFTLSVGRTVLAWVLSIVFLGGYLSIMILFMSLRYKNTFYVYTNKRLIVRTGIFGVDFKSLDMKMVGAFNVNVSLLDKIIRKNTGTLTFGSMSSPMNAQASIFRFANITNPYEKYKEIKEVIESCKEN